MIVADEICNGTEHTSSMIIITSIIKILCSHNVNFITATHNHDIV